jgi:RND family efflux transporter MFP subunit
VEPPRVEVLKVLPDEMSDSIALHGQLTVPLGRLTQLASLEPGYLARLSCREGEFVHEGQVLAEITAGPSQAQVEAEQAHLVQAQAKAQDARLRAERTQELYAQGAASSRDQQNAASEAKVTEASVQEAHAALSIAQRHLAHTDIRAPYDGWILRIMASVGQALPGSGPPILEMADLSILELFALATSEEASRLAIGQLAQVHFDALPGQTFPGKVVSLSPGLDLAAGVTRVRVQLDTAKSEHDPRLGLSGVAVIQVGKRSGVMRLPLSALQLSEGEPSSQVLVLSPDGHHVLSREVHLGVRSQNSVEITQGLTPGESVVIHGGYGLPDGAQVVTGAAP